MRKLLLTLSIFLFTITAFAQTTYKKDSGFFTPIVKSLYLRGGVFEDAQLIGPAVGYRFNETYDVTLHTEFLSNEYKFGFRPTLKTSLLNIGVILGRTADLSDRFLLRSELSLYQAITLNTEAYNNISKPSLTSGMVSSSLFWDIPLSKSVSLLPNLGAFLGYGNYSAPYSTARLRQGFDGFIIGPKVGFDVPFNLSDSFYLVVNPKVNIPLNKEEYGSTLLFNVQLNF
ncbi:hypothetical protein [Fodinibius halophilus]|uniref:Outer membrane beta-barrel protein n=1 Tax=Fodinibius halophilus TaxID=1736908 RepID=A0A6M1TDP2_9BACT|nr:hypothetical protein [Fodinibius halophilus]NGP88292.1 hypothetical protein [Fodinibius halophilus]